MDGRTSSSGDALAEWRPRHRRSMARINLHRPCPGDMSPHGTAAARADHAHSICATSVCCMVPSPSFRADGNIHTSIHPPRCLSTGIATYVEDHQSERAAFISPSYSSYQTSSNRSNPSQENSMHGWIDICEPRKRN